MLRYISELRCPSCGTAYPADRLMNLCPTDQRPVEMILDHAKIKSECGDSAGWDPSVRSMWRFGAMLPLDWNRPEDRQRIVSLGEGATPLLSYDNSLSNKLSIRLQVKDEGSCREGFGANPTLSFKDRGMAMTVSLAKAFGLTRLAVPTQGNAGDSLATYAIAAGIQALVVMSPETDMPVLGRVAALAKLHPQNVELELVEGTIIDCAAVVREKHLPRGFFNVATFQEPGWRIEGKKTLGLELAEPSRGSASQRWSVPDVIIYPTGGGTGVLGMAKAFDDLEALGLIDNRRPRMVCVQSEATAPIVKAFESGAIDCSPMNPGRTIATGLNVARNVGHVHVLRIVRETGGCALTVSDEEIRSTIQSEWRVRRFAWSPEGAATLAALPKLADLKLIHPGDRVVLVNTASAEKYLPSIRDLLRDDEPSISVSR